MMFRGIRSISLLVLSGFFLAACANAVAGSSTDPQNRPTPAASSTSIATGSPTTEVEITPDEPPPFGAKTEFKTDFSKHSVPYSEILSGGPPKDGIPAIDQPRFVSVSEADDWLKPVEPVIFIQVGEDARAYPIQIFMWHEIVNDTVGDLPLVVTFCPLCNTAIAFERTVGDQVLDFGTTGRLRFSNLIMYDRQTETWWQQATGEAIAGSLTGTSLAFHPAAMLSWEAFKAEYPDGKVLSRETGFNRPYGNNPYTGYDDISQSPFLYRGPLTPGALPPMARVITLDLNGEAVAYPFEILEEVHVVNDTVGGQEVVIFWQSGTSSALDSSEISKGRDVGAANTYSRRISGQTLTFKSDGDRILDDQTGSVWDPRGQALSGEFAGQKLEPVVAINHFWFSWAAFNPKTRIYQP